MSRPSVSRRIASRIRNQRGSNEGEPELTTAAEEAGGGEGGGATSTAEAVDEDVTGRGEGEGVGEGERAAEGEGEGAGESEDKGDAAARAAAVLLAEGVSTLEDEAPNRAFWASRVLLPALLGVGLGLGLRWCGWCADAGDTNAEAWCATDAEAEADAAEEAEEEGVAAAAAAVGEVRMACAEEWKKRGVDSSKPTCACACA